MRVFVVIGLTVVGLLVGAVLGLPGGGDTAFASALFGACAGFCIGLVREISRESSPTGPRELARRVAHLEADVRALKVAVAHPRSQPLAAATGTPLTAPVQPAAESQAAEPEEQIEEAAELPVNVFLATAQEARETVPDQPTPAAPAGTPAVPTEAAAPLVSPPPSSAPPRPAPPRPAPPRPAQPRQPYQHRPDPVERLFAGAWDWLTGGNTVVRVGIIVLFFGVAFLLKYAADNGFMPIQYRLAGVAVAAAAMIVIGWRIGDQKGAYGLVLQGGGVGILYLTVYAATKLYPLLPTEMAFPLLVVICALSAFLAVRQNALPLAFMGSVGGFLAPVLMATNSGSHVVLFSYYALLNAGIFAIAWFRAWRSLNVLGFVFTFIIGTAWGVTSYRPEFFWSTEPFLILFFLMYVGIALLYAVRRQLELKHYADGTLLFGTPIVTMGLQAALVHDIPFGLAWSAVAMAAVYLGIAVWLRSQREQLRLLFEATLALAVIFLTLAVPLAFSGLTTSAAWAIEGAGLVWLGVRQRRAGALSLGLLMQVAAAVAFVVGAAQDIDTYPHPALLPVFNSTYLATLLLALAGVCTGWLLHGRKEAGEWQVALPQLGVLTALWGLAWWIGGGLCEIARYAVLHFHGQDRDRFFLDVPLLFLVATAWLAHGVGRRLVWPAAGRPALLLVPVLLLFVTVAFSLEEAPTTGLGLIAWPVAILATFLLLWQQQRDVGDAVLAPLHMVMFWNVCALFSLEGFWRLRHWVPEGAWSWSAWAYGYGLILLLVAGLGGRLRWPVARFAHAYQWWGCLPLVALLWGWSLASLQNNGDAAPLPWLPILNPLDVAQLLILVAVAVWLRRLPALGIRRDPDMVSVFGTAALASLFLWLNAGLLRALYHWGGVPYRIEDMVNSTLVQASVSIFWTVCALILMIGANRRAHRPGWIVGAVLLAATVVKLFLFDLSHIEGIERIVSFIGIGVMLLLIGYFAPLPPRARNETEGQA